jgi:peptide deformylase
MPSELSIVLYPDPRLKRKSQPVERFDVELCRLAASMLELMRESRGVGLAAPQVGQNIRLFVTNPSGDSDDDHVYINPELCDPADEETGEEGCLSIPRVNATIIRSKSIRIRAQDLNGKWFEQTETGWTARIWQHELDHLNGTLIIDRMGPTARLQHRKILKELEDEYAAAHPPPPPKPPQRRPNRRKGS